MLDVGQTLLLIVPVFLMVACQTPGSRNEKTRQADVVIYDATPAGIAAAMEAADNDYDVLMVEHTGRIGGLVTNGLSHTDFRTFEGLTGTFLEFTRRVEAYYRKKYGENSEQVEMCLRGTHAEPKVNLNIFRRMVDERERISTVKNHYLTGVETSSDRGKRTIDSATFTGPDGERLRAKARLFIDASYEGDLMARADVPYRVGQEAEDEYNESLAPKEANGKVQGYNFRLIMTDRPENRVKPKKPEGYDREDYLDVLPLINSERIDTFRCRWKGGIYKFQAPELPNGKYDVNDVSGGAVRLSLPQFNNNWPDGDRETRRRIFRKHFLHNVGLLYFLQNDPAVPEAFQKNANQWGFCRDEFVDNNHVPERLYVREARRMMGMYVFNENDTDYAGDGARTVLHRDAIAMGDYGLNSHGTGHQGPVIGGTHTGEFYRRVPPYQIPYGTVVPKNCTNLLVPVAASATHIGFSGLRLEPIFTSMGQASGMAAAVALDRDLPVQDVPVDRVQKKLHENGAATIYVSDVLPDHEDFAAVQWWGTNGGLHGLSKRPEDGPRGEKIGNQYYQAYPGHALHPDRPLTEETRERWLKLAEQLDLRTEPLQDAEKRGSFIRRAYRQTK